MRKRFLRMDTLGLVLGAEVSRLIRPSASGRGLSGAIAAVFPELRQLREDGGYSGTEFARLRSSAPPNLVVEDINRTDALAGFRVLPEC